MKEIRIDGETEFFFFAIIIKALTTYIIVFGFYNRNLRGIEIRDCSSLKHGGGVWFIVPNQLQLVSWLMWFDSLNNKEIRPAC